MSKLRNFNVCVIEFCNLLSICITCSNVKQRFLFSKAHRLLTYILGKYFVWSFYDTQKIREKVNKRKACRQNPTFINIRMVGKLSLTSVLNFSRKANIIIQLLDTRIYPALFMQIKRCEPHK